MLDGRFDQHFAELFAASDKEATASQGPVAVMALALAALIPGAWLLLG